MATTTPTRRMGTPDSAGYGALLDATERVLRTDGYAAISSRRVAQEAGLKQQLVYYYFHTMDDLLLATFQRRAKRAIERLETALASPEPLRALWQARTNAVDARVTSEFLAIANHHPGVRAAATRFVEDSRQLEIAAIERLFGQRGVDASRLPPAAAACLITCIPQWLMRESEIGIATGHAEVEALVERMLAEVG
jgi:AcrR family transcriptional regulator